MTSCHQQATIYIRMPVTEALLRALKTLGARAGWQPVDDASVREGDCELRLRVGRHGWHSIESTPWRTLFEPLPGMEQGFAFSLAEFMGSAVYGVYLESGQEESGEVLVEADGMGGLVLSGYWSGAGPGSDDTCFFGGLPLKNQGVHPTSPALKKFWQDSEQPGADDEGYTRYARFCRLIEQAVLGNADEVHTRYFRYVGVMNQPSVGKAFEPASATVDSELPADSDVKAAAEISTEARTAALAKRPWWKWW